MFMLTQSRTHAQQQQINLFMNFNVIKQNQSIIAIFCIKQNNAFHQQYLYPSSMIPCTDLMMFMLCAVGRRVWVARSASGGGAQALSGSTQSADAADTRTTPAHRHPTARGRPHARGRADRPVHGGGTEPVDIICCRVKKLDSLV